MHMSASNVVRLLPLQLKIILVVRPHELHKRGLV